MKTKLAAILAMLLFAAPASAQMTSEQLTPARQPLTQQDREFLLFVAQTNVKKIATALLGQNKAKDKAVLAFARLLSDDHANLANSLAVILNRENIQPPMEVVAEARNTLEELANTPPREFSIRFIRDEIRGNARTARIFAAAAEESRDPLIKALAIAMLAVQEQHTALARALDAGLSRETAMR